LGYCLTDYRSTFQFWQFSCNYLQIAQYLSEAVQKLWEREKLTLKTPVNIRVLLTYLVLPSAHFMITIFNLRVMTDCVYTYMSTMSPHKTIIHVKTTKSLTRNFNLLNYNNF